METTVMIGEKPKVASRLANALGNYSVEENRGVKNYVLETDERKIIIAPAVGHIYNLEQTEDGWDYPVFEVEWQPIFENQDSADYVKKYYNNLSDQLDKADTYINACDFDVEGSTIGGTILREMIDADEDRIQRMKFSTLTPSDLQEAFDNLEEFDRGMTEAGITRHILDFYYGINVSRALMKAVRAADRYKTLSTGRVQGPTLKILADREREIRKFEPDPYWELYANHSEFQAQWEDDEDRIWDEETAEEKFQKVKDEKEAEVTNVKVNNYKHNPPIPFNLTGLQSEASSQLNISPKQTQSIAQTLYENGLISYPRTESQKLPPKIGYKNILKSLKGQEEYDDLAKKVLKKDKNDNLYTTQGKKEDDAHPAIYPTGESPSGKLSKKEKQVYDLIVKRFFAVFGKAAKRRSITFTLDVKDEEFKAKSKITVERNWYDLYEPYVRVDSAELPEMEEGQTLQIDSFDKEEKETQPPNRYSQSGIVNELEKRNLGTKCLTGNQEIIIKEGENLGRTPISKVFGSETDNGTIQMKELEENVEVVGFENNFSLTDFAGLSRRKLKENETVLQINLEDDSSIELTSNHPVLTVKDDKLAYKQAGSLKPKDKIIRAHRGSLVRGNEVEFDEFVKALDKQSSLYGSCDLRKLRNRRGFSQRELAKKLDTPRSTLSEVEKRKHGLLRYWKNADIPKPDYLSSENFDLKIKNPFPLKIGPAFLRLTAMLQGDGSLDSAGKNRENKIDFRYHNTEEELIEQFRKDIQKLFGFKPERKSQPPSTGEKTRYYIRLPAIIGRIISIITQNLCREWIMKQEGREHYIGAMIADEGHVSPSEPKIFISNTNKDILRNCRETLKELKIDSKMNEDQKKLYVRGRENLERFLEKIPLFSTRKHQALIDLLERHYKYGEDKGSLEKEKNVLKALQRERKQLDEIAKYTGLKPAVAKHHLDNLREKGYAKKIIEGISEKPRKKIYYKAQEKLSDTFYSEIGEKAVGEAHTATIKSLEKINYNGYVYDILDTENQNFLVENRCVVHNSTRAQTVDRLYDRNYIEEQPIEVTDLGLVVVETLEDYSPDLVSEDLTREFEQKMDAIRDEKESRDEVLEEAQDKLIDTLTNFKENEAEIGEKLVDTIDSERKRRRRLGPCQECEDGMLRIIKKGGSSFVGCSNYPDCENTYPLPNNGNINSTDQKCEECGKLMIYVDRKKGKNYQMCIDPDCPSKDSW